MTDPSPRTSIGQIRASIRCPGSACPSSTYSCVRTSRRAIAHESARVGIAPQGKIGPEFGGGAAGLHGVRIVRIAGRGRLAGSGALRTELACDVGADSPAPSPALSPPSSNSVPVRSSLMRSTVARGRPGAVRCAAYAAQHSARLPLRRSSPELAPAHREVRRDGVSHGARFSGLSPCLQRARAVVDSAQHEPRPVRMRRAMLNPRRRSRMHMRRRELAGERSPSHKRGTPA